MPFRALMSTAVLLAACTSGAPTEAVPAEPAGATYEVFPATAPFGDPPRARLLNSGEVPLEYRHDFVLDILEEGTWRPFQPGGESGSGFNLPSDGLVLHPGKARSQRIVVCPGGQPLALPAGTYRVTKTVLTIPAGPDEAPVDIDRVVEFDVAEPDGDVPGPRHCVVLCMSDTHVEPGQIVRVSFAPPRRYTWGVPSTVHAGTEETIMPVAFLTAWKDRDEKLSTSWPGRASGYEDVGFGGRGAWRWKVPARLDPGVYSIVKHGISGGRAPVEERTKTWTVSFRIAG